MDPGRAAARARATSGTVAPMHARRTTFLLLVTLLTSACVAVPHDPAPAPQARPGGLAPAADRAPAPLPAWSAPAEPAPREALTTTEPRPEPRSPRTTVDRRKPRVAAEAPAPSARRPPAHRPHIAPAEPGRQPGKRPATTRTVPRPVQKPRTHRPPAVPGPEMRRLCRQAESLRAPMGAADLCRGLYG
ncbi:hypothetical protein PUR59_15245 [Streptomyces sp. SP18ES09]|uniref:hypothetical protein n=1 Tax=Streptomyces sp. SP18ES09 TaxID=3002532 RepID=UPI002E79BF84|nr:hypothetical protein [Streptomyces sp. SP18ES09]MEE1816365.1 hypothetical protein [Streptomyces sp. SP18ES09]